MSRVLHLQIAAKVARVEARDGQPVAVAGQHGGPVGAVAAVLGHLLQRRVRGAVQVRPDLGQARARDAAALVRDLPRGRGLRDEVSV